MGNRELNSSPLGPDPRRFFQEETGDGIWGAAVTARSPDRAVGMCGHGAQHGVAVGTPALAPRVLASISPDP